MFQFYSDSNEALFIEDVEREFGYYFRLSGRGVESEGDVRPDDREPLRELANQLGGIMQDYH